MAEINKWLARITEQRNTFGDFTARISAFDINDVLLGSFVENGTSNPNGDNSAIFIGLLSNLADIYKLSFQVDNEGADFAINSVSLAAPVPLPAALPLFASGLGVMAWMARRRKRMAAAET